MRLAWLGLVSLAYACGAAPAPLDGTWHLTRTVTAQPTSPPGCHSMTDSTDTVTFDLQHDPQIVLPEHPNFDPTPYPLDLTDDSARFTAEEFGLLVNEPTTPVLIAHDLHVAAGQLVGTARSLGDGPDFGCTWLMSVVGTR